MANSHPVKKPRLGVRQSIQLTHATEEAKRLFSERLDKLKQALTPGSSDNLSLMSKLMEIAENHVSTSRAARHDVSPSTTFLKSAGKPGGTEIKTIKC